MPRENSGFGPEGVQHPKRTLEYGGKSYEVFDLDRINESHIEPGDRALITTASGNRYMLRRSRSNDNRLFAYRERDGFSNGGVMNAETLKSDIATIGMGLRLGVENPTRIWESTPVTAIELRKGIDSAIEDKNDAPQAGSLAAALIERIHGKRRNL